MVKVVPDDVVPETGTTFNQVSARLQEPGQFSLALANQRIVLIQKALRYLRKRSRPLERKVRARRNQPGRSR